MKITERCIVEDFQLLLEKNVPETSKFQCSNILLAVSQSCDQTCADIKFMTGCCHLDITQLFPDDLKLSHYNRERSRILLEDQK